ncbi:MULTISPECIES: mechanosensitive ion channel domain-containing protein [unclassified Dehalobacter]|uniref:mechanosensitive ion channel family protein n=1 Tax=unclassified Dehalobacter TaxID=2635733 RepID=UPI000E6CE002|nr:MULTISPECIES: mechanosensitive ion channel domain-containing protein [unclassified Dehalobacter]RJE48035.1 mechanosensitive ion channel protein MscS [Dehalobacter sp. MCB1]TCX50556.1 mechanosensitive ion channel protein MscS [Dehalobacter sp. 14DCB1]TCX52200.1 mechanosensitive ion channel protein MscS [Dehalobacter sp. 12DCB1]
MIFNLNQWLIFKGIEKTAAILIANAVTVVIILLISILAFIVTKQVLLRILAFYIHRNKISWDDKLLDRKVFRRLAHMIPAIVIYAAAGLFPEYSVAIQKIAIIYIIVVGTLVMLALLDAIDDIYHTFEASRFKPIRSIIQALKIVIWIIGGIWMIATMIDRSPLLLLSGIGAVTAIILLIFKDSLLGLVAGIQLSSNDMLRIGDWIEMPKYGADGDVTDISLHTVKVRNFDNTITTVPTYVLISDSFKNWRGMQESGGRRIKRSIFIDSSSIRFCSEEMLEKFSKFRNISDYIDKKREELAKHNLDYDLDPIMDSAQSVNARRLTNIGTFRAYLQAYLKNHPEIHPEMARIARQLPLTEHGIPIEIYAYTKDTSWESYEAVQADIFDHILAIVPEFELRVYQSPTGYDLRHMGL